MHSQTVNGWPLLSKSRLASWRKLRLRKEREKTGLILIEGLRLVGEAIACQLKVEAVLVADDHNGRAAALRLVDRFASAGHPLGSSIPFLKVGDPEFAQLTDTVHSSGLAAVVSWQSLSWEEFAAKRIRRALYCDHLSDPGNLGTLIRTAGGLGLDAVLISPESVEATNPKVVRASAGALFRIPVVSPAGVEEVMAWAAKQHCTVYLADVAHQSTTPPERPPDRWILVIGGETQGLSAAWVRHDCHRIGVKMAHGIESFNAGVAGALLMDRLMGSKPG